MTRLSLSFEIHDCIESWCKHELLWLPRHNLFGTPLKSPLLPWRAQSCHDDKLVRTDGRFSKLITCIEVAHVYLRASIGRLHKHSQARCRKLQESLFNQLHEINILYAKLFILILKR
jgi:hypothetical protein